MSNFDSTGVFPRLLLISFFLEDRHSFIILLCAFATAQLLNPAMISALKKKKSALKRKIQKFTVNS